MLPDSRACTKCGVIKTLDQFSAAPRGKYGRKPSCKACDAARYARNPTPSRAVGEDVLRERWLATQVDPKTCTGCGEAKPRTEFSKARDGKYGPILLPQCKLCRSTQALQWFHDNKERHKENSTAGTWPRRTASRPSSTASCSPSRATCAPSVAS